jgi:nucleoside-diphosphate-sugar epimerase
VIIGNGLLANAFGRYASDDSVVIFASGVSNSNETSEAEFERERRLLAAALEGDRKLVYFSSCGVIDAYEAERPYIQHKRRMEALVLASPTGYVLRLPQVVGPTGNPHTLTNFLRDRISSGERFTAWARAERNLVDIDDVAAIGSAMIDQWPGESRTISIAGSRSSTVPEIVAIFEHVLGRQANCTYEDKGHAMVVSAELACKVGAQLGIDLGDGYAERIVRKYYGSQ